MDNANTNESPSVTVEDAIALRAKLEADILQLLLKFRAATGLAPSAIEIVVTDVRTAGTPRFQYCTGVRVTAEL